MIYDCFTFFNELDILEIRLNVLNDVVDKFVLVESTKTFSGQDKPLFFKENIARFKKFENKIIHVIVEDTPEMPEIRNGDYWALEFFQRNAIVRGLTNCKNEDAILVSDCDEIPNPEKVLKYQKLPGIKVFKQKMFYYYLNNIDLIEPSWTNSSTRMLSYADFVKNGSKPQKTKFLRGRLISNGGWHFTYIGGAEKVAQKIKSFAHILREQTVNEYTNIKNVEEKINKGEILHSQKTERRCAGIKIDNSFPKYIRENTEKYKSLICDVNINFYDKLILYKNETRASIIAHIKNKFFTNHINNANYENN